MTENVDAGAKSALHEWRDNWRAVVAAGLGVATGISFYSYVSSLFIPQYAAEFGWTRAQLSFGTLALLTGGMAAPAIGRIVDRFGVRPVLLVSLTGFGLLTVAMATQNGDIRVFYGLFFLFILFGVGTGTLAWTRVVVAAFSRARGLALSVALSMTTITTIVMPPLLQGVIEAHGWRAAWLVIGAVGVCAGLFALSLLPRTAPVQPQALRVPGAGVSSLRAAARTPGFWLAIAGMFLINIPSGGIMNQMAVLIADKGPTASEAALVMSAFALSVFIGRLIAGICLDRFPAGIVAFVSMAIPAIGCVLLTDWAGSSLPLVIAGLVLAGLSQGAEGDVGPYVIANRFGLDAFSGMIGALNAATASGTAAGAILFAQSFDRTGSYDPALLFGAAAFVAGAICYLSIRNRKPPLNG